MIPSFSQIGHLVPSFEFSQVLVTRIVPIFDFSLLETEPVPKFDLCPIFKPGSVSLFDSLTLQPFGHLRKMVVKSNYMTKRFLPFYQMGSIQTQPHVHVLDALASSLKQRHHLAPKEHVHLYYSF